ncbi:hypothetical protein KRM28CT15_04620 [Krasilnikovia sp. M28-CT-15]
MAVAAPAGVRFTQLTAGNNHTCGLGSDTRTYCWGWGPDGQLGNGTVDESTTPVPVKAPNGVSFTQLTAGEGHTCGLGNDTRTYCWGWGADGQLGNGGTANRSSPVAVSPLPPLTGP